MQAGMIAFRGFFKSSTGTINVERSQIMRNQATGRDGGLGGGLAAIFGGVLNVEECKIAKNHASGTCGSSGFGGGIYNDESSATTIAESQITRNHAHGNQGCRGGGVYSLGGLNVDQVDSIFDNHASGKCDDLFDLLTALCV
jgi:hypothetical protein